MTMWAVLASWFAAAYLSLGHVQRDDSFTAFVGPTIARFEFPVAIHAGWKWHDSNVRDNWLECRWTVTVHVTATILSSASFCSSFPEALLPQPSSTGHLDRTASW